MSKTVSENRVYFVKALNEAIAMKMLKDTVDCNEDSNTSLRHRIIMKRIAKGKCLEQSDKVFAIRRAVLITVIAAIFALTSCTVAIVYRKKIAGFIERTFDDFVSVTVDDENSEDVKTYPTEIEKIYEFTYVPDGYELKSKIEKSFAVGYIFENTEGEMLKIRQKVIDEMGLMLDNEKGYSVVYTIDGIDVYSRDDNSVNTYLLKYNDYMLQIQIEEKLSENEFSKIIKGIK